MDEFKRKSVKDYTAWDLNCKQVVPHTPRYNKHEKLFKRKARRKMKKEIKNYEER